jgi:glutamate racemase
MAQQVIYLADRASFPYGGKTRSELLESVTRAIRFLEGYRRSSIIVASNSPSVIVLKDLRVQTTTPLYGIVPPVREAVTISRTGHIGGSGNSIPH